MLINYTRNIFRISIILVVFFNTSLLSAQCAGTSQEVTICEKDKNENYKTFNLHDVLLNETLGGVWVPQSNFNLNALDPNTGILNLWQINKSGTHVFTYTNPSCDSSSATVTINLGGYPGESNLNIKPYIVCQEPEGGNSQNLFNALGVIKENEIVADINGTWSEEPGNPASGVLGGQYFMFDSIPLGIYRFKHTVPVVGTCSERSQIIHLLVVKGVFAGEPLDLNLCSTDDLSLYKNLDLYSRLDKEDTGGEWSDISAVNTGQITSSNDFEIDLQEIYKTFGAGTYKFRYDKIKPEGTCKDKFSEVTICIQENLVGSLEVDSCEGMATLSYNSSDWANGLYDVLYTLTGSSTGTRNFIEKDISFSNGVAQIDISNKLGVSENVTLQITNITPGPCDLLTPCLTIAPVSFEVHKDPIFTVSPTLGCELDDILVIVIGAQDATFQSLNGPHTLTYGIGGTNFTENLTFLNGNARFTVPFERLSQPNGSIVFFDTNSFVYCGDIIESTNFPLSPAPENPDFTIKPNNRCDASTLEFGFDAKNVVIDYSYDMYEYGSEPELYAPPNLNTALTNITKGKGPSNTDVNDVRGLPDGDYVFRILTRQDMTQCRDLSQAEIDRYAALGINIKFDTVGNQDVFDVRMIFRIGDPIPAALVKNDFEVCLVNGPVTLSELPVYAGQNVDITIKDLSGVELPNSYSITKDETFVAVFTSALTGCNMNSEQFTVKIVSEPSAPDLKPNVFCSLETPTVGDLDVSGQNIIWYDASVGGQAYNNIDILDNTNKEYWAEIVVNGGCVSTSRKRASIEFIDKPMPPTVLPNVLCSLEKLTISDLKVQSLPGATLQWYTSQTGEAYSSVALPLDMTKQYWVSQTIVDGCESDRIEVKPSLGNVTTTPVPLSNDFCTETGIIYTIDNLSYTDDSISSEGTLQYFSDQAGMNAIPAGELLSNLTSPIYVKQVIAGGTCSSAITGVNFTLQGKATKPTLSQVEYCSLDNPTIQNLETRLEGQTSVNITLYADSSTSVVLDGNLDLKTYVGDIYASQTIAVGCESTERTLVDVKFTDKATPPVPLTNEFCSNTTPTIADLSVESDPFGILKWYTSQTGEAYSSTTLPLDQANQYWVSQSIGSGCESDRIEVKPKFVDQATTPVPLNNDFCLSVGSMLTLEALQYDNMSESDKLLISYYSDQAGQNLLPSNSLLTNLSSPVYAKKNISGTCSSDIVAVNFTLQGIAPAPSLSSVILCSESNAKIQDLETKLEGQTLTNITLYADSSTSVVLDGNLDLKTYVGDIYASQTIVAGCESTDRTLVQFSFDDLAITTTDFNRVLCSKEQTRLNQVYLGTTGNILWFDSSNTPLLGTEIIQEGITYIAQLEVDSCLSDVLQVTFDVVDVPDPIGSPIADFCGIKEKTIADLLYENDVENSPSRFTNSTGFNIVWYDSNDVSVRNQLSSETVLKHGTTYYAVYEKEESIKCESNPFAITVNLTDCSLQIKELIIPDAFSPNDDKVNDTFELLNIPFIFPDYTIDIYNRYGRLVFKGNVEIGYWDGKVNQPGLLGDEVLPTGVYFYVINFNRFGEKPRQGQVYLKR